METPQPHMGASHSRNPLSQLEDFLEEYLVKKAPYTLPQNAKDILVKAAPWITMIFAILFLPLLAALFGLNLTMFSMMGRMGYVGPGFSYWNAWLILSMVAFVLEVMAIPGLFKRSLSGWHFVYYSSLITLVMNVIATDVSSLIGAIIGLYFLFQVKSMYK